MRGECQAGARHRSAGRSAACEQHRELEGLLGERFSGAHAIWIDRDDFLEDPPKKFFRLAPGREVRLRYGYVITCTGCAATSCGTCG